MAGNIVPRANKDRSIGTLLKKFLKGWFYDLHVEHNITDETNTITVANLKSDHDKLATIEQGAQVNTVVSVNSKTGSVVLSKSDVGLGNVDNTSDNDKPISSAVSNALSMKADLENGKVPSSQLPSYVDDAIVYNDYASLPITGESGKIYITADTNITYRWTGSMYVEISASLALGETSNSAHRGDHGKTAYDHSQITNGNPHNVTRSDVGLGSNTTPEFNGIQTNQNNINAVNAESLTGNKTLTITDATYQFLNPNGANRDVTLPNTSVKYGYLIKNTGSENTLIVKNSVGATLITIYGGEAFVFIQTGTTWEIL